MQCKDAFALLVSYLWAFIELPDEMEQRFARVDWVHDHACGLGDLGDELKLGLGAASITGALRIGDLQEHPRRKARWGSHFRQDLVVDVVEKVLIVVAHDVSVNYCHHQKGQTTVRDHE